MMNLLAESFIKHFMLTEIRFVNDRWHDNLRKLWKIEIAESIGKLVEEHKKYVMKKEKRETEF
ncbi:hypothetical protein BRYFOR_08477 [Marvinbryantia formatexigens DSM 14469]|uniref:Uncharacterized protein n=1 Tax=Marvinbryantia formatexigens DSM 14469 TaxID=478749 RepID=C6LIC3_9FIRM|nr:hypothetical protein BRYFOR_08477 [Marvinbryantia formatexigens DSM 14469]